jgi:hypothetical protein
MTANESMRIDDGEGWDPRVYVVRITLIYFWREKYHVMKTDGAFHVRN